MKSITFYPRREFFLWLSAFILSNVLNAYSIQHYHTEWKELFTQLGYVFLLSLIIYGVVALIRILVALVRKKK
jgi:hypothetical protein